MADVVKRVTIDAVDIDAVISEMMTAKVLRAVARATTQTGRRVVAANVGTRVEFEVRGGVNVDVRNAVYDVIDGQRHGR